MQLSLEAEARAELIFIFAADAFDVGEFVFDFVVRAGCKGARTPAAQPTTRARAALTRACARGLMAHLRGQAGGPQGRWRSRRWSPPSPPPCRPLTNAAGTAAAAAS